MEEDVLLDQAPHPNLLLGPPPALQFTAGQHGIPVWLHLGPDLWDALTGVWGGAHHLRTELGVGGLQDACMNLKRLFFQQPGGSLDHSTILPSKLYSVWSTWICLIFKILQEISSFFKPLCQTHGHSSRKTKAAARGDCIVPFRCRKTVRAAYLWNTQFMISTVYSIFFKG